MKKYKVRIGGTWGCSPSYSEGRGGRVTWTQVCMTKFKLGWHRETSSWERERERERERVQASLWQSMCSINPTIVIMRSRNRIMFPLFFYIVLRAFVIVGVHLSKDYQLICNCSKHFSPGGPLVVTTGSGCGWEQAVDVLGSSLCPSLTCLLSVPFLVTLCL
jgi:hypothetical protein